MRSEMEQDLLKVLVTEEQLRTRVAEMGADLHERFRGRNPLFLGVLKGCFVFMADLVRASGLRCGGEIITPSSYQNSTVSSGEVRVVQDLPDIAGRDLIVVEDILDTGRTLSFLCGRCLDRGAASVTVVTLLDKPARRAKAVTADLAGFVVPDEFVVGYGLDYAQKYRNIPYICVLKPEIYAG